MRRPSHSSSTHDSLTSSFDSLSLSASSSSADGSRHTPRHSLDSHEGYEIILPSTLEERTSRRSKRLVAPLASPVDLPPADRPAWGQGKSWQAQRRRHLRESKAQQISAASHIADEEDAALAQLLGQVYIAPPNGRTAVREKAVGAGLALSVFKERYVPSELGDSMVVVPSGRTTPTIMSSKDASSSIDSFLTDTKNFTSVQANKLRLWQALCIEFGLVQLESAVLPDLPYTSPRPLSSSASSSRSATPTIDDPMPRLPHTLKQAKLLLRQNAHINLVDYLEAKKEKSTPVEIQALMYPSKTKLLKATKELRKWAKLDKVKGEWLTPLLKDFAFSRRRM